MLIIGVLNIRAFFKRKNATDFINTGMLLRHAGAFGLYLVCTTAKNIAYTFVSLSPGNQTIYNIFSGVLIGNYFGQFLSQLLLCDIFWDLGTDTTKRAATVIEEQE